MEARLSVLSEDPAAPREASFHPHPMLAQDGREQSPTGDESQADV